MCLLCSCDMYSCVSIYKLGETFGECYNHHIPHNVYPIFPTSLFLVLVFLLFFHTTSTGTQESNNYNKIQEKYGRPIPPSVLHGEHEPMSVLHENWT